MTIAEKILNALKAKFPTLEAKNQKILEIISENRAKGLAEDADITPIVGAITISTIMQAFSDQRVAGAVSAYEKKYNLKDGEKIQTAQASAEGATASAQASAEASIEGDMPKWAKTILDQNKILTDELKNIKTEKLISSRKGVIDKIIAPLTEVQKKPYQRMSLDSLTDEQFEALKQDVSNEAKEITSQNGAKQTIFSTPIGGNKNESQGVAEASKEELNALLSSMDI